MQKEKSLEELMSRARGKKSPSSKTTPNSYKTNYNYFKSNKSFLNPNNSNHVVVKITGGAKNDRMASYYVLYDTQQKTIPIFNNHFQEVDPEEAISILKEDINDLKSEQYRKNDNEKLTYRLVFSMNGKVDKNILLESVHETLVNNVLDYEFFFTCHEETNNNHVHVTISKKNRIDNKKLNLNKKILNNIKNKYAESLNKRGITASFKSVMDRQTPKQKEQAKKERAESRRAAQTYIVNDFGQANYLNDSKNTQSFYLKLTNLKGRDREIWSKTLESTLIKSNIKKNDAITIQKDKNTNTWNITKVQIDKTQNWITGIVKRSGEEYYNFDKTNKKSYFVELIKSNGESEIIWQKRLKEQTKSNNVQNNDIIRVFKELNGNYSIYNVSDQQKKIKANSIKI